MFICLFIILIAISSAVASFYELELLFAFMGDIEKVLLSLLAYSFCPMHRWREKIVVSMVLAFVVFTTIHNTFIYTGILPEDLPAIVSAIIIVLFLVRLCARLMTKWDSMESEEIEEGYIYEVIGKPKRDLNFLAFVFSGGKGGTWAHTDGVTCWYFSTTSKVKVAEPLNLDYLIGRKVIKIGLADDKTIADLNSGVGKSWSLINNCWFSI